ncbi:MAG: DUF1697 domain-containing protein [Proteobacteria bacterium]|nr:DUF1697 domain-containing protein [Pseudomonadota bacterium]
MRGINVGKTRRIPMEGLRGMLAECGYGEVATLLNSGNVVFGAARGAAKDIAAKISAAIAGRFEIEVPVIVKTAKELQAIVAENPFASAVVDHSKLLVAFAQDSKALTSLLPIGKLVVAPEGFAIGKNAAYLYCARGILKSSAGVALLGKVGKGATSRNWGTVLKLNVLANERAA